MAVRPVRTLLSVVMDLLVVIAVVLLLRLVVAFFAAAATAQFGVKVLQLTKVLVIPFGLGVIRTPYGGVFELNTVVTLILVLAVEWVLGLVRNS